ncbi:unnamed protein product [Spirodela intermedia]|uniref:Uncharacterized protein n=1 Tax=Spirodela intermedia TaxID=51605 RepID=A0A7I8LCT8_SPIIN|nr:unnamed protein product [Spirodela intermedia]
MDLCVGECREVIAWIFVYMVRLGVWL